MKKRLFDIGVSAAIMGVAGLVYWDALKYKPGTYDPLGSGAMPRMVAMAIVILCVVAIVQSLLARPAKAEPEAASEDFVRRPWLAVAVFVYLLVTAVLLYWRIPFGITGSLLLFVSVLAIKSFDRSIILPGAICSAAFGFGLSHLFGAVFGVDLP
jgi:putative tricarboxylic transport membrane protein